MSDATGNNQVWMMRADGSSPTMIASVAGGNAYMGDLSPNGRKLAYVEGNAGAYSLRVKDLNTGVSTAIGTGSEFEYANPDWSPDGSKIAYYNYDDDAVHVMNADGTGDTPLSNGNDDDQSPAWSADGSKIIVNQGWDGSLVVMGSDGSSPVVVKPETTDVHYAHPQFLLDGRILATRHTSGLSQDIVIMNANGSNEINLTPDTDGDDEWFPTSLGNGLVAFATDRNGAYDIYVGRLGANGLTGLTNLTANTGDDCWRPKAGVVDTAYFNL
jgi:Tol biopolymer transport system component